MPKNVRFWRNVTLIGLAHVAVIYGLIRWSRESKPPNAQSIVWMSGGAGAGDAPLVAASIPTPKPVMASTPPPQAKPLPTETPEEDRPILTSAKSEIELPNPTPTPTPTATATPTPKPIPTPVAKVTPKPPKPPRKPTPKPKPKPTPPPKKLVLAKASPKPSPKAKPTPAEADEADDEEANLEAEKQRIATAALEKAKSDENATVPKKVIAAQGGTGKSAAGGAGGHGAGAGGESPFGWYGNMLHDRFHSEWVQPTTTLVSGTKLSALVKIRIEKDGRISNFQIIKGSGNEVVDESVSAVAKRVTQVDALPAGLGNGEHYEVKINFELNSEQ
jgi:TonB family protein